jgi:hypothetical protein
MVDDNTSTWVKDISSFVRREYGESISYSSAWRARERSRQVNSRDREEEFSHMTNFVSTLQTTCLGPICDCVFDEVDRFQRIFVCPSPLIETFSHSLGMIALDGTHLKSGFGGILVTASNATWEYFYWLSLLSNPNRFRPGCGFVNVSVWPSNVQN